MRTFLSLHVKILYLPFEIFTDHQFRSLNIVGFNPLFSFYVTSNLYLFCSFFEGVWLVRRSSRQSGRVNSFKARWMELIKIVGLVRVRTLDVPHDTFGVPTLHTNWAASLIVIMILFLNLFSKNIIIILFSHS